MRGPGVCEDEGIPTLAGSGEQWGPSRALVRLHNAREGMVAERRAGGGAGAPGLLALVRAYHRLHNRGCGAPAPGGRRRVLSPPATLLLAEALGARSGSSPAACRFFCLDS